jgi:hypothetical protein
VFTYHSLCNEEKKKKKRKEKKTIEIEKEV